MVTELTAPASSAVSLDGVISITIYIVLIVQLIYFWISNLCYLYHNSQYRVFWAAFCIKQSIDHSMEITTCDIQIIQSSTRGSTHSSSSQQSNNLLSQSKVVTNQIRSKRSAFIHHGLETLSHCILLPLYLLCILCVLCIRLVICYITYTSQWSEYRVFCSYAFRLFYLKNIAHFSLLISMCIPALKIQHMYNSSKCQRALPVVSIVFMLICIPTAINPALTIFTVKEGICIRDGGIGANPYFMAFMVFQYYLSLFLCFSTVIVPIYVQRKMLINLPRNQENEELLAMIQQINALSKRVCVSAVLIIIVCLIVNMCYYILPWLTPFISVLQWLLYVEGYLVIIFIYKDWRMRLCPLCGYNHIRSSNCKCLCPAAQEHHTMTIQMASAEKTSSIGVPNLIRDITTDEIRDNTFSKT
eukprot:44780_1